MYKDDKEIENFNLEPEKIEEIEENVQKKTSSMRVKKLLISGAFIAAFAVSLRHCSDPMNGMTNQVPTTTIETIEAVADNYLGQRIATEIVKTERAIDEGGETSYVYIKNTYELNPVVNSETGATEYFAPNGYTMTQIVDENGKTKWVAYNIIKTRAENVNNVTGEVVVNEDNSSKTLQR